MHEEEMGRDGQCSEKTKNAEIHIYYTENGKINRDIMNRMNWMCKRERRSATKHVQCNANAYNVQECASTYTL